MNTVALTLIVKNEEKVIARCVESYSPIVDAVVVVDTGSTDDTETRLREACQRHGLPLTLEHHGWKDFGDARSKALEVARGTDADVLIMPDADWVLELDGDKDVLRSLDTDVVKAWNHLIHDQGLEWPLPRITANKHPWAYDGVVHEFLTDHNAGGIVAGTLPGLKSVHLSDGGSREGRHHRDVDLLKNRKDPRSKFYYAQSLYAVGRYEDALQAYRERASMAEGWAEEAYFSMYRAGSCALMLQRPDEAIGLYMYGWGMRPHRIEALMAAVELWRTLRLWTMVRRFSDEAVRIAEEGSGLTDSLFIEKWRWEWGARWEQAVAQLMTGDMATGIKTLAQMLRDENLPPAYRDATEHNLRWARGEAAKGVGA